MNNPEESQPQTKGGVYTGVVFAITAAVLALLTWFAHDVLEDRAKPKENEIRIHANKSGHYKLPGYINGELVSFILDTGATHVTFPVLLAESLGLEKLEAVHVVTANGMGKGWRTHIDELNVGGMILRNVPGTIASGYESADVLLGMSALGHLKLSQSKHTLIIKI